MKKKNKFTTILLIVVSIAGLSLLLYPTVADYWNLKHQTRAIASYVEQVENLDEAEYEAMWQAAVMYNSRICARENVYQLSETEQQEYNKLLDVSGTGIMGYIEIPTIEVSLPIYHGTDDAVLQIAAGHLNWTSLPVGGLNTHCVISGHRGLPSARLFTDITKLREGDRFVMYIMNEPLTYEVDQKREVLPSELDELKISEGKDYCTLVTCTPYGINTHRLLIRGHRVANDSAEIHVTAEGTVIAPMLVAPLLMIPFLLLLFILVLFRKPPKKFDPKSITIERTPL